ncbi:MAG: YciI family protein [Usitatibacter sp.]
MKFICLVYNEERNLDDLSEGELGAFVVECGAWVEDLRAGGHYVSSMGLQSVRTATTVRIRGGKVSVTDGPFAETKEQLGGFTLIDARDLNEALQIASRLPAARIGSIEVRPVLELGAQYSNPLDRKIGVAMERHAR